MPRRLTDIDGLVLRHLVAHGQARWSRSVTVLGAPKLMLTATAVAGVLTQRSWPSAMRPVAVLGAGLTVRHVLCLLVHRPRPPERLWRVEPDGYSFPSKHVTTIVLAASGFLSLLRTPAARWARGSAALTIAGVAVSRMRLGVHWPTDVLGGMLFGEVWLWLTRRVLPGKPRAR
ncbi:MAG: phosphatase PAP2 family protein [Sciscionella sp.]